MFSCNLQCRAISRGRFQTEMAPRGIGRQFVLQRPIQNGRVALSSTLKILSERAAGDLREGRTERLTPTVSGHPSHKDSTSAPRFRVSSLLATSVSDAAESGVPSYFPESLCSFCKASLFPSRLPDNNHRRDAERSGKNTGLMNR